MVHGKHDVKQIVFEPREDLSDGFFRRAAIAVRVETTDDRPGPVPDEQSQDLALCPGE